MASHKSDINVGIKFNANTQQARQQLQQLQNQLDNLISSTAKNTQMPLNKNLKEALNAAAQLKVALQAATNVDTGNLDLSKFSAQLKQSGIQLKDYAQHFINLGPQGEKAFMDLTKSIVTAEVPLKRSVKLFDELWTTMKNTARWEISSRVLHGFESALSNAYRYAQDLNKSLTDIRIVTGYGADRMADFAIEANKAAKALSTTTNEYAKASLIYFQQGLSDSEVQQRADITVKMANVTRDSAQTVSDQMTAIWNNFADGSKTLEYYADVMTALGAETASSTAEISQGLEKFAAVANTVGLSYEYATAALATITSETRESADVVGTALKTLFARIQGLSLGETLEDGTDLNKYSEALAKVGISIKEQNGELKDMDIILNEMAGVWGTLSRDQQVALAQTVAGVRQYNQLIALMSNWDTMQDNLDIVANSSGELQKQQDIYAESWEAARDRVTAALEDIYNKILDSDFFIDLTNILADITEGFSKFIDMAGGLPGILSLIASLTTKIFGPQIAKSLQTLTYNFEVFTGSAEAKANTLRKQAKDAIDVFNKDLNKDSADYLEGEVRKRDIDRSFELQQMKNISDETREYYQNLIDIERQYGEIAVAAAKAAEAAEEEQNKQESIIRNKMVDVGADSTGFDDMTWYSEDGKTAYEEKGLKSKYLDFGKTYEQVSNIKISKRKRGDSYLKEISQVKDLEKLYPKLAQAAKAYDNALQGTDKTLQSGARRTFIQELEKAKKSQLSLNEKVHEAARAYKAQHPEVKISIEELTDYADAIQKTVDAEREKTAAQRDANRAQKDTDEKLHQGVPALTSYASSIVNVANGISSVIFGLTSMKSAFEALNNTDMSFSEKLGSFFTSFSMSVGSLISGLSGLGQGIKTLSELNIKNFIPSLIGTIAGLDVETQVTGKNIKEKLLSILVAKGWITAEQAATMTVWGLTKALLAQVAAWMAVNWWILAIVAAIGLLVAAFVIFQQNTPEKKLEKLTKEAEKSKNAAEEAANAYEQLKNTIEGYNTAVDNINTLTKGTEEFTKAVEDANKKAKELIDTYNIVSGVYLDENGIIQFEEGVLDNLTSEAEELKRGTAITAYADQQKVIEQQYQIDMSDTIKNLFEDIDHKSFSTETDELIADNLEQILKIAGNEGKQLDGEKLAEILGKNYKKGSAFADWIDTLAEKLESNEGAVNSAWAELMTNTAALNNNTAALLAGSDIYAGEEWYENSEYKNTISNQGAKYANEQKDKYYNEQKTGRDENNNKVEKIDLDEYLDQEMGIKRQYNYETQKTQWYNSATGEWYEKDLSKEDKLDLYSGNEAQKDAIKFGTELQSTMDSLSPLLAAGIEAMSGGKDLTFNQGMALKNESFNNEINNLKEKNPNLVDEYLNWIDTFNPYENFDKIFKNNYKDSEISPEQLERYLVEAREWWTSLPDEDKTLAMSIQFTEGEWEEQLDTLKAEALIERSSNKYDLDPEIIKAQAKAYQELYSEISLTEEASVKMAIATQRAEKGVAILSENWEKWSETIKEADNDLTGASKTTTDYIKTIVELTKAIADLTGQDDLELSQEFFEIAENIELIEEAAKGSEKAIAKLGVAVQKDIVKNLKFDDKAYKAVGKKKGFSDVLLDQFLISEDLLEKEFEKIKDTIMSGMDLISEAIDAGKLQAGESIDSIFEGSNQTKAEWVQAMNDMAEITAMSVQEMNEMLSGLHLDAEVSEKEVDVESQVPIVETTTDIIERDKQTGYPTKTKTTTKTVGHEPVTQKMMVAQLGVNGEAPGDVEITSLGTSNISPSASGDSSGGGGGSSGSSAEPLEYEDEIERYHENTRQLERLERALNKVSTAKDRAFGKERLRLIDQEIAATERLVAQQRALLHETREYLKQDFAEIQQYGFTYDEFGELTNYDEVMKEQIDRYNAAVATGNAEVIEAAREEYEEFKENMEQYEETLTQYEEAQAQLQEYINQVVDLKLEKITTEVEIKILVNDKELTRLEYLLRKVEYEGKGAADAIALMGRQFEQISEKAKPIQEAIDKIYEQARAEGRGLLEEEVKEIKSFYQDGVISSEEEKRIKEIYDKAASEDRMLTQAEEEQIQEYKEQLLELNEEVMDIVETIEGKFMETLEELNGKVDESIGRFATYTGMFQTLSDVITLSGKANSKYGMDMLNTLSARTVANASTAMRSNLRSYEALDQLYKEEQANLERAIKTGDERLIKQYQDRLHEVEMMRETSYESMLSSWSEALQAANDLFDTKLTNMIISLKQNLGDIDKLVEIYDRAVELEDLYISGNKSIYELSKLARDVGKDIDKTANIIAKNKLVSLLDQINKTRAEGVKLSQYDLEYWQAKYELELAEIALQEAQEAKAQVKLTRNTAGGWGYTYVADAEAISEAQQNYEDSLYNMQELHDEYIRDYSERLIKNRQDLVNALQDLDKTSLTFEEDALRLKEHHFKQEEYLIDELNKVYQRAGISYQDTLLAQTYGGASLEDSHTNFINSVVKMIQDELLPGYQEFQESVDGINSQAGTTVEDAMDKIFESSMTMEDEVIKNIDDLTTGVKEVSDEIWNFQETYGEAISKMLADNEEYYSKTIKMYQNFMTETEADKWLQYFDDMRGPGEVLGIAGSGATGTMAGNGSTAVTNSAFGDMMNALGSTGSSRGKGTVNVSGGSSSSRGEGVHLRDDGTYGGIASIHAGEERIPEAAMRALREDPSLKGMNLNGYAGDDGSLSASELKKLFNDKGVDYTDYIHDNDDVQRFGITLATGGYTGSWGAEGRLAILHEKELVLNKYDTENMLDMVNTLRDIDWRAKLSELWTNIEEHFIAPIFGGGDNLQQDVRIEASFPGVSNHTEIEEAFNNLINTASQYANRKRY